MKSVDTFPGNSVWCPEDDEEVVVLARKTPEPPPDPKITAAIARYRAVCKQLGIIPSSRFIKQIGRADVSLCSEQLDRKEMRAVCVILMGWRCVYSVDLSGNSIGGHVIGYLSQLLKNNTGIRILTLSNNCVNRSSVKAVTQMVALNNTLQVLDLSGNNLTDKESRHLASMMKSATALRELSLSHNELRERGGLNIGEAIAKNSTIDILDLSWNHLRCKGAESIALGLKNNFTITTLNLAWNGFGFEGCVAMSHALHANRTLLELDLSSNRIHPPALFELANGLVLNNTLETLKLGSNPITVVSATPFLGRLKAAPHMALSLLDLSNIIVDCEFEPIVREIQMFRPGFHAIFDHSLPINKNKLKKDFDPKVVLNVDPIRLLYFTKKNMRIIDFFNKIDKDHSYSLTRAEIKKAMEGDSINLSSSALDTIMEYIDVNHDGEIDMREFADAERRFKRMTLETLRTQEERAKQDAAQGAILPSGPGTSFSSTYRPNMAKVMMESTFPTNTPSKQTPGVSVKPARLLPLPPIKQKPKSPSTQ